MKCHYIMNLIPKGITGGGGQETDRSRHSQDGQDRGGTGEEQIVGHLRQSAIGGLDGFVTGGAWL